MAYLPPRFLAQRSHGVVKVHHPHLVPGQIFRHMISMQTVLYELACWLARWQGVQMTMEPPVYNPHDERNYRPCIFLYASTQGIHVLPMGTFGGSNPAGWNLFLQEIVVPVGNMIPEMFSARRSFQTTPDWKHPEDWPTYVVPHEIVLPYHTHVYPLPPIMPRGVLDDLSYHCESVRRSLRFASNTHARRLLKSYEVSDEHSPMLDQCLRWQY
ncbi:hypothetical protein AURDEDRAFT_167729 [Auricularia subglabra TFB-10046 SS5]|nr:hypothetical protein AURDEDRAFT_167729 [Auricularia subglabra TFB-10046 SS5]